MQQFVMVLYMTWELKLQEKSESLKHPFHPNPPFSIPSQPTFLHSIQSPFSIPSQPTFLHSIPTHLSPFHPITFLHSIPTFLHSIQSPFSIPSNHLSPFHPITFPHSIPTHDSPFIKLLDNKVCLGFSGNPPVGVQHEVKYLAPSWQMFKRFRWECCTFTHHTHTLNKHV